MVKIKQFSVTFAAISTVSKFNEVCILVLNFWNIKPLNIKKWQVN